MTTIQMGNDEFILYIRKVHPGCATVNDQLGRSIWDWISKHDAAAKCLNDCKPDTCLWGASDAHTSETTLPKTARQFEFERKLLPSLYDHLDALDIL